MFIISYSGNSAESIKETVKTLGSWFNHFTNQYLVCTSLSMKQIIDRLNSKISQEKDLLLVLEIDINDVHGWLPEKGWKWIISQREKLTKK